MKTFKQFLNERAGPSSIDFTDAATRASVTLVDRGSNFLLTSLETPIESRGLGGALRVMQQAIEYATTHEKNIELTPIPDDDTDETQLINFYKKLGFRKTGNAWNHMRLIAI